MIRDPSAEGGTLNRGRISKNMPPKKQNTNPRATVKA